MIRLIDRLRLRLRSLVRGRNADAVLARELALHLEEQTRENLARGMSPADARAAARRAFGSVAVIEEQCRDTRRVALLQNLGQDLRYGLRSLLRQPLLMLAATASIAIGVGANSLVFSLASELLLSPPSARAGHELVHIGLDEGRSLSEREWRDLDESGALAGLAGYNIKQSVNWRDGDRSMSIVPLVVTANFFDLVGVPIARGRGFTAVEAAAERDPRVVVVSQRFWRRRLDADPRVVGRTLLLNGEPYTILGVLPADHRSVLGLGVVPELYLPLSRSLMPRMDQARVFQLVGRLEPDQALDEGRAALNTVGKQLRRAARDADDRSFVQRFVPVSDGLSGLSSVKAFFALLLVVVVLVLAIACANVAGLFLSRSTVRRREIAVRIALGASRGRLVQQLIVESLWLALLGTLAGLLLMLLGMEAISRVKVPLPLPFELRASLDLRLFAYMLGLATLATLLSGLVPALEATRPSLTPAMKHDVRRYLHRRWTLRGFLVTAQVAVSMVLLVTSFLFLRNLARTYNMDPGFDTSRSLVAQVSFVEHRYTPDARAVLLQTAVERLEVLPGVERASVAFGVPLTLRFGQTTGGKVWIEGDENHAFEAHWAENMVGPGYFQTLGIRLRQGRDFGSHDARNAPKVIVVNDVFVQRYLGGRPPLGLRMLLPGAQAPAAYEIVGVVGSGKHRELTERQLAAIYYAYPQQPGGGRVAHVVARTRGTATVPAAAIAKPIGDLDPTAAVDVQAMNQAVAFAFLPSRLGAALLGSLGAIGLTLAMGGLFAMLSYSVTRRTREIGVRMALGATTRSVAWLVMGDATVLVATGMTIGLALAAFVTRPLAMFLVHGLSPGDPVSFAGTTLLFALVSAAATLHPMRRATGVDPVVALREE